MSAPATVGPATAPAAALSVVVPAFNAASTLEDTLSSLLPVRRSIADIVISDDGSRDGTPDLARAWAEANAMPLHVVTGPNAGPGPARDRGLARASGRWVLFLDADDTVLADGLERLLARAAAASPGEIAIAGGYVEMRADGRQRLRCPDHEEVIDGPGDVARVLAWIRRKGPPIHLGSTLVRRGRLRRPAFPEARVGEDRAFLTTVLLGGRVRVEPVVTLRYHLAVDRQWQREAERADDLVAAADFIGACLRSAESGAAITAADAGLLARAAMTDAQLTAMRACAKAGDRRRARMYWRAACRSDRRQALRWRHLRRLL